MSKHRSIARRQFLATIGAAALFAVAPAAASAQTFDQLKLTAPAAPGGGWDQTAREMQKALTAAKVAKTVTVNNVPGAGGTIGLAQFVNAKPDPNSLLVSGMIMVGAIITNNAAVTLKQTTPIARLTGEWEVILVPASSPHKTLNDLIAALKANPGAVSIAGGSAGGTDHILAGLFVQKVGADVTKMNYIPYSGGGESLAALLGAQVAAGVNGYAEMAPHIQSGKLRALGISSPERIPGINIPTLKEQGVDLTLANWRAVVAAPNLTAAQRDALVQAITTMAKSPAWQETLKQKDWDDQFLAGDQFAAFLEQEQTRIAEVLKSIGLAK